MPSDIGNIKGDLTMESLVYKNPDQRKEISIEVKYNTPNMVAKSNECWSEKS